MQYIVYKAVNSLIYFTIAIVTAGLVWWQHIRIFDTLTPNSESLPTYTLVMLCVGVWTVFVLPCYAVAALITSYIKKALYPFKQFNYKLSVGSIPTALQKAFYNETLDLSYFENISPLIKDCILTHSHLAKNNVDQVYTFLERKIIEYKHPYWFIEKLIAVSIYSGDLEKTKKSINQFQDVMLSKQEHVFYSSAYHCAMGIKYSDINMHKSVKDVRFFGSLAAFTTQEMSAAWQYNPNRWLLSGIAPDTVKTILNSCANSYEKYISQVLYLQHSAQEKIEILKKAVSISPTHEAIGKLKEMQQLRDYKGTTNPKWLCYECYVSHPKWGLVCFDCLGLCTIVWNSDYKIINPLNAALGNRKFWLTNNQ